MVAGKKKVLSRQFPALVFLLHRNEGRRRADATWTRSLSAGAILVFVKSAVQLLTARAWKPATSFLRHTCIVPNSQLNEGLCWMQLGCRWKGSKSVCRKSPGKKNPKKTNNNNKKNPTKAYLKAWWKFTEWLWVQTGTGGAKDFEEMLESHFPDELDVRQSVHCQVWCSGPI